MAPEAAGFCCRGGTTLLVPTADDPAAEPGLGEVGGLVAVLLASLEDTEDVQGGIISSSRGSTSNSSVHSYHYKDLRLCKNNFRHFSSES